MSYYAPDLTGLDPNHAIKNDVFAIFKESQKVVFNTPVFADSIVINHVGTLPSQYLDTWEEGTQWEVQDDDVDEVHLSRIKVYDATFSKRLVNSITIINTYEGTPYNISINYQRLYPNQVRTALYNNEALSLTPELIAGMLTEIDMLRLQIARPGGVTTPESATATNLEIDVSCSNDDNLVTGETHTLNTPGGIVYIQPVAGSFYLNDELKVFYPADTTTELVRGTDYKVVGMDVPNTKISTSIYPVYQYLVIMKEIVGEVAINYHGFGGEPTLYDYKALLEKTNDVIDYLSAAQFVTEDTLLGTTAVTSIVSRIISLEDSMRRFLSGTPSYGDKTSGVSKIYKITAPDNDLHFWNLATLYKVDGSEDIITADRMHLRIATMQSKFMMDVYISFNLNNPDGDKLAVSVVAENYPRGYVPFVDYSEVDAIIRPQFRVIWNQSESVLSGAILQIGLELKNILTESIGVEDFSGSESCWKLVDAEATAVAAQDTAIELPALSVAGDLQFIWDVDNSNSAQESVLAPFGRGHLVWAGTETLNRPGGHQSFEIDHFLDSTIDHTRITKVRLELAERGAYQFPLDIDTIPGADVITGTASGSYYQESLDAVVMIYRDETTDELKITLNTNVVEDGANPLDLMGVVIYTC